MTEDNINGLIVLGIVIVIAASVAAVRIVRLRVRGRNIVAAGWPPPWLDVDGDAQCSQTKELAAWQAVNESKRGTQ